MKAWPVETEQGMQGALCGFKLKVNHEYIRSTSTLDSKVPGTHIESCASLVRRRGVSPAGCY